MTQDELREKIAGIVSNPISPDYKKADRILVLVKEAGLFARKGYVKLVEDQTLPADEDGGYFSRPAYSKAQQDMLKAGWRRVEVDK